MKVVFEAGSGIDAHMISNLLEQQGIVARVDGEYLQGGVGDLQAHSFIKVRVNESDYKQAKSIISDWESEQELTEIETPTNNKVITKTKYSIPVFILGLLIGAGLSIWSYNSSPVIINGIDYNDDGILDEKWIYKNNQISQSKLDRNFDNKVDVIYFYDRNKIISTAKVDDNFDGIFESEIKYQNGNVSYEESDLDQDGNIDQKAYYKHGVLYKIQIIGNSTTSPKKWQEYKLNKLVSSKYDSNGDGKYDVINEYDFFEERK